MYVPLEHAMRITASGSPRADVSATFMRLDAVDVLVPEETDIAESVATLGRVRGRGPQTEGTVSKLAWSPALQAVGGA